MMKFTPLPLAQKGQHDGLGEISLGSIRRRMFTRHPTISGEFPQYGQKAKRIRSLRPGVRNRGKPADRRCRQAIRVHRCGSPWCRETRS